MEYQDAERIKAATQEEREEGKEQGEKAKELKSRNSKQPAARSNNKGAEKTKAKAPSKQKNRRVVLHFRSIAFFVVITAVSVFPGFLYSVSVGSVSVPVVPSSPNLTIVDRGGHPGCAIVRLSCGNPLRGAADEPRPLILRIYRIFESVQK